MRIGDELAKKQLSIGKEINNQLPIVKGKRMVAEADEALNNYSDLICPQFKAWYCKMFYIVGPQRFAILASQARADGIDKPKLFSSLLRKETNQKCRN